MCPDFANPLAATPAIAAFAEREASARGSAEAKARALYDALIGLIRDGRIVPDRDNTPKARDPLLPCEIWERIEQRGSKPVLLGCLELTSLYLAMARSVGLKAQAVEPTASVGNGAIGHVLARVDFEDGNAAQVDLQNRGFGRGASFRQLTDDETAQHYTNHLAVAALLRDDPVSAAKHLGQLAATTTLPQVATNWATFLANQGKYAEAVTYARRAVLLAPSVAVYHYQLGHVLIDAGELCAGLAELAEALRLSPGYFEVRSLSRRTLEANPTLSCGGHQ